MSFIPEARGAFYVDGQFSDSSDRLLKGANVVFRHATTDVATAMDAITCVVADVNATTQYTLTTISTPAIELETPSNVYFVESIDVTNFADGDITLTWTGELDGTEYEDVQTVKFNAAPAMMFVSGATTTLEDFDVVLDQAKTYSVSLRDSISNVVDGYAARGVFYDTRNGAVVNTVSATLQAAGTGLWSFKTTLSTGTYYGELKRYELYWQVQKTTEGSWYEVRNSRVPLKVYSATTDVQVGVLTYSTNAVIRQTFPGIDKFLEDVVPNQGEREILLNRKRQEASFLIYEAIKNTRARTKRDLLEMWEAYEVYRLVLLSAHSFAKFAVEDGQLKMVRSQIARIRHSIFGSVSTIRIGGRSN